jgi:hypothetical protein
MQDLSHFNTNVATAQNNNAFWEFLHGEDVVRGPAVLATVNHWSLWSASRTDHDVWSCECFTLACLKGFCVDEAASTSKI